MPRKHLVLERIDNDHLITGQTDPEFIYTLQAGLLLALKEQGVLNETQYRYAEEKLRSQRQENARKTILHRGNGS